MSWLKVDDGLFSNPKILEVSGPARLLYLAGLCHCAGGLTDGRISKKAGPVLLAQACAKTSAVRELVDAGLWQLDGDAWVVPDYLDYNPSRDDALAEREKARLRQARKRAKGAAAVDHDDNGRFTSREESQGKSRRDTHRDSRPSDTVSHPLPVPSRPTEGVSPPVVVSPPVPATDDDDRTFVLDVARARGARIDPNRVYGWSWLRRTADSLEPHRARILALRAEGLNPAAIDLALDGHTPTPPPPPAPAGPATPPPWTPTIVDDALDHDAHAEAVRKLRSAHA